MKCQNMATDSYGNDASANFWHSATGIEVQEESGFRWIQAHNCELTSHDHDSYDSGDWSEVLLKISWHPVIELQ